MQCSGMLVDTARCQHLAMDPALLAHPLFKGRCAHAREEYSPHPALIEFPNTRARGPFANPLCDP
jgi:hypothetical protein